MLVGWCHALGQQGVDCRDIAFLGEEIGNRRRHGAADVRQHSEQRRRSPAHALEAAQPVGQCLRGRLADMADAQGKQ